MASSLGVIGQRCLSEREPELGLGLVASAQGGRIEVRFPGTGEKRLYALGTPVLKRVQFRIGESVTTREGAQIVIEAVEEDAGLLTYVGKGSRVREDAISDVTSVNLPPERLLAGQVDPVKVFDLRLRALRAQAWFRQSEVRGFLGGRLDLIPHQFYILQEVARRQIPRVLLADEVGLGKTIEACLILQRLLAVGQAKRVLILVPESLVHQWFVELLRRFNLWFSIYDEGRCLANEQSDPGQNPFLAGQLALASLGFLAGDPRRRDQAVAAGWDMVVVDEAHHLEWKDGVASPPYALVEQLAARSPGLLLLSATPTQLGMEGHFARLRLLDPDRYNDYDAFLAEAEAFGSVAEVADKIIGQKPLRPKDVASLRKIFRKDPERLDRHLDALARGEAGAKEGLLRTLLDQHGTGRVVFRNTRANMSGFPKRKFCPAPLKTEEAALFVRISRELQAEETGGESAIRYSYKDDPRIDWLVAFLKAQKSAKVLLICKSQRKVAAIEAALQERMSAKSGLFHEGLPLVQRDRNAAWFAEPDGAQILLCSEIGSEGRNFQFAHHLVLFDLPLNPGLLEQRIGRLDRIGQTETIRIHAPYIVGGAEEFIVEWYRRGLDAFETSLPSGNDYQDKFKARLLELAVTQGAKGAGAGQDRLEALIAETIEFRRALVLKMEKGRDRLLELNSFNAEAAEAVIARVRESDADPLLRNFLGDLLDHFGVRVKEHEGGDVFLDPSHAYVEAFPSIPREGMLATYSRQRAISREDLRFISPDHSLFQDAVDLLIESKAGTTAFAFSKTKTPNLLLEAIFVLEAVADSRWHVEQFLAPQPVRVLVDFRGNDLTDDREATARVAESSDGTIQRFLERPSFNAGLLKTILDGATGLADAKSEALRAAASAEAAEVLTADRDRLVALRKVNPSVRLQEIELAEERLQHTATAIAQSRLRLDSIRLIVESPAELK